jgi:hypothetical protein
MLRVFRTITSLLLTGIFLVSFTGLRLLVHHCAGCGTSELVIIGDASDCCMNPSEDAFDFLIAGADLDTETSEPMACCAATAQSCGLTGQESCCDFESMYLKADLKLMVEKPLPRLDMPVSELAAIFTAMMCFSAVASSPLAADYFIDPPPRLAGRDFVLYAHQLKFC